MNTKLLIGGVIGVVVVLLVVSQFLGGGTSDVVNLSGTAQQEAPNFTLSKVGGGTISLSDYKGEKAVVLDFFATWCPNCRRDMPRLSKMYKQYGDQVEIIGVNLQESETKVEEFAKDFDLSFPLVMDPNSQASRA